MPSIPAPISRPWCRGIIGVEAAACTNVPNPQLSEVNQPKINGTGGNKLAFCSISANQNNTKNCDDGQGVTRSAPSRKAGYCWAQPGQGNNAFPHHRLHIDDPPGAWNNGSAALSQKDYRTVTSSGYRADDDRPARLPGQEPFAQFTSNGGTSDPGPEITFFRRFPR